jgi:ABC-type lipoprotein release transport system permease subunit
VSARLNPKFEPLGTQVGGMDAPVNAGFSTGTAVESLGGAQRVPLALSGLLALAAIGTLVHTLVTSIRRRRRDLAILKTLGFVRCQVSATVAWQATTLATISLVIGLPVGVAVGRWAWTLFANAVGVLPAPVVDLPPLLFAIPVTLLLANLVALIPGRLAAATQPAVVLRSE